VHRYVENGRHIEIEIDKGYLPTLKDLHGIEIFLYTIEMLPGDSWVKVNNKHNGLDTEYKTEATVTRGIVKKEKIDMEQWLQHRKVTISEVKPAFARW